MNPRVQKNIDKFLIHLLDEDFNKAKQHISAAVQEKCRERLSTEYKKAERFFQKSK